MKKKILKKGVSLLTATALVAGMLNGMENLFTKNVEAAEVVKYEPKVAGVNLIPLRMTNNSNFMRNYVLKKDGYNITKKYSAQSWKKLNGKINSGDGLSTDRKYWHSGNEHWEANFNLFRFYAGADTDSRVEIQGKTIRGRTVCFRTL